MVECLSFGFRATGLKFTCSFDEEGEAADGSPACSGGRVTCLDRFLWELQVNLPGVRT